MTDEEIIQAAVERALLVLPEVVGNLMAHQVTYIRMNKQFYDKYPEFRDHKNIVAMVIEDIESKMPHITDYEELLRKAVPEIRNKIRLMNRVRSKSEQTIQQ